MYATKTKLSQNPRSAFNAEEPPHLASHLPTQQAGQQRLYTMSSSTEDTASTPTFLQGGPLYAFSLPQELLQVIQLRSALGGPPDSSHNEKAAAGETVQAGDPSESVKGDSSALRCSLCGVIQFDSIAEQRAHFSSDWHRYNIKRSLSSKAPVKEQEWSTMVDGECIQHHQSHIR